MFLKKKERERIGNDVRFHLFGGQGGYTSMFAYSQRGGGKVHLKLLTPLGVK